MSLHRFYVPESDLSEELEITLPVETGRQISRVLRMHPGDIVGLFDGSGNEWPSTIKAINRDSVVALIGAPFDPLTESTLMVTVCPALVASDRMDYIVQKSTELGAVRVLPIMTERVQSKDAKVSENRIKRWQKIAIEATEQSGRVKVPEISHQQPLTHTVSELVKEGPAILLWEGETRRSLRIAVRESLDSDPKRVSVFVGPVGGLSEGEATAARSTGAITAGMGRRILRAETAPVTALSALMFEAGELG